MMFLFIKIATTSVPSRHAPNLITKPTPIPSNNPPNTVAKSISLVSSGTGLNCSSNTENTNIAYAAFIKKLFPNCLYPKIKKGIFKTKVRILNLTLVILIYILSTDFSIY